jgi:YfiH family protein
MGRIEEKLYFTLKIARPLNTERIPQYMKHPVKNSMSRIRTTRIAPSSQSQEYIVPDSLSQCHDLIALQSTRNGGISDGVYSSLNLGRNTDDHAASIQENFLRLCAAASIDPKRMVSSTQVHGTAILIAEKPGQHYGYDAFITNKKNLFLCIFTADCYPVLLFDPRHKASGAVHAGWKGSAGEIVMKTINAMRTHFNSSPEECIAYIGTGISPTFYEVSREIAQAFPSDCYKPSPLCPEEDKYLLDLGLVNYRQLLASGILPSNIELSPFCSFRDSKLFFSHRRDQGKTGRMISLIGVKSPEIMA